MGEGVGWGDGGGGGGRGKGEVLAEAAAEGVASTLQGGWGTRAGSSARQCQGLK